MNRKAATTIAYSVTIISYALTEIENLLYLAIIMLLFFIASLFEDD